MAFQGFYTYGKLNREKIWSIMNGTTYGSGFIQDLSLSEGQTVFNTTFEQPMAYCQNPTQASGDLGTFMDANMIQLYSDSGLIFKYRWVYLVGSSTDFHVEEGSTASSGTQKYLGTTWNDALNSDDFVAVQIGSICSQQFGVASSGTRANFVTGKGSLPANIGLGSDSGGSAFDGDWGVILDTTNLGTGGYIDMLISGVESY